MRLRGIITVTALLVTLSGFGQIERTYNWAFGNGLGLNFPGGGNPVLTATGMAGLQMVGGAISDLSGNFMFYSDGKNVYDGTTHVITGVLHLAATSSSPGSGTIVPMPGTSDSFYVIYQKSNTDIEFGIYNSTTSSLSSTGHLIQVDCAWGISVVEKCDQSGYWLALHRGQVGPGTPHNDYYICDITGSGIAAPTTYSCPTNVDWIWVAGMQTVFSPDGSYLGAATINGSGSHHIIFPFDNATGVLDVANPVIDVSLPGGYQSIAFSANSRYVYGGDHTAGNILRYDLSVGAPSVNIGAAGADFSSSPLQLGPDGNIYYSRVAPSNIIARIENANTGGLINLDYIDLNPTPMDLGFTAFPTHFFHEPVRTMTIDTSSTNCLQANFTLDTVVGWYSPNQRPDSINWDFGDGNIAKSARPNLLADTGHIYTTPGVYNILVEAKYGCIRIDSFFFSVEVFYNDGPEPNITNKQTTLCTTDPIHGYTADVGGGAWTSDCGGCLVGNNFDPSVPGAGTYHITYSITGLCGGALGDTDTVVVSLPTVAPNITNRLTTVCTTDPAHGYMADVGGGTWTSDCGGCLTGNSFDPSAAGVGTHHITYSIANVCGGFVGDTDTVTVILPTVDPNITNRLTNICATDPAHGYTADVGGGAWTSDCGACLTGNSFDPATAGAGTYHITYSIANVCGGFVGDTDTVTVVTPGAAPNITNGLLTICTTDPAHGYTADIGGGTWTSDCGGCLTGNSFDPATAGVGTWHITYSVANPCGGNLGDTDTVQVVVPTTAPNITNRLTTVCTTDPTHGYTADLGGGTWTSDCGGCLVGNTFDPATAGVGTYHITYSIANICGGFVGDTDTVDIISGAALVTIDTTGYGTLCSGDPSAALVASPLGGTWAGTGVSGGSFDPSLAGAGNHTITYTLVTSCATLVDSATITVIGNPTAGFTYSPTTIETTNPEVTFTNISTGATNYHWDFGGLDSSLVTDPIYTFPSTEGTHLVILTAYNAGCPDTASALLTVEEVTRRIYVPNAFSPGGNNPLFRIVGTPITFEVWIYDRYGAMVYHSNDATLGWDGTFDGDQCNEGTYVYYIKVIEITGEEEREYTGSLMLVR